MEQRTVEPSAPTTFAQLAGAYGTASESPIYDSVVRQWLKEGREVPRPRSGPGDWMNLDPVDLFRRD